MILADNYKRNKGFTLIELLVVIAIIGILSSVVLAALNSARLKARNVQRVSQLTQVRRALELYYDDHGYYPKPISAWARNQCNYGNPVGNDLDALIPELVPEYMPKLIPDSKFDSATCHSTYIYGSNGKDYAFFLNMIIDPGFNYNSYPAFILPWRDGGTLPCSKDGSSPNSWGISSEGACSASDPGTPW